jgi:hypothetical protein
MLRKSIITMAAWLEIVVGGVCLTAPAVPCLLLFAAKPDGVAIILARFAGIGLFTLGISCLPSKATGTRQRAILGLFVFNLGVAVLFVWVGVATTLRGVLLWPAVALHAVIAAALLPHLLTFKIIDLAHSGQGHSA